MSLGAGANTERSKQESRGTEKKATTGTQTQQLQLEQEAVDKIVQDVLGGAEGLASIFAGEQATGLFNSSVANQEAGDLAANLVGEIAKLTGKTVSETDEEVMTEAQGRVSGQTTGASMQAGISIPGLS